MFAFPGIHFHRKITKVRSGRSSTHYVEASEVMRERIEWVFRHKRVSIKQKHDSPPFSNNKTDEKVTPASTHYQPEIEQESNYTELQ